MNMDVSKNNDCSIRECFEKFVARLEAEEKHLKGMQESVAKSSKDINLRRQSAEELHARVTKKEEELKLMQLDQEKGLRDLELKKKEMGLMLEKLEDEQKRVAEEFGKLEKFQKSLNEQWKMKEKILDFRAEALDAKEKELVAKGKELAAREKLLDLVNTEGFAQPKPDNIPNGAHCASQKTECSARNQSKKRQSRDDGDQVKDKSWDSVKDTHTPSPSQQPPMPASQATFNTPEQRQQQAQDAATIPTASSVKNSRIVIEPFGDSFNISKCYEVIQDIWERYFADKRLDPVKVEFSSVSADDTDKLFTEFKQIFSWSREHDALIHANWKSHSFQRFYRVKNKNIRKLLLSQSKLQGNETLQ